MTVSLTTRSAGRGRLAGGRLMIEIRFTAVVVEETAGQSRGAPAADEATGALNELYGGGVQQTEARGRADGVAPLPAPARPAMGPHETGPHDSALAWPTPVTVLRPADPTESGRAKIVAPLRKAVLAMADSIPSGPPPPQLAVGNHYYMRREVQQNDSLADGYPQSTVGGGRVAGCGYGSGRRHRRCLCRVHLGSHYRLTIIMGQLTKVGPWSAECAGCGSRKAERSVLLRQARTQTVVAGSSRAGTYLSWPTAAAGTGRAPKSGGLRSLRGHSNRSMLMPPGLSAAPGRRLHETSSGLRSKHTCSRSKSDCCPVIGILLHTVVLLQAC